MIIELAKLTRKYLENNHKTLNLPFISSFPHNSCETASLLLGRLLIEEYPKEVVYIIKGRNKSADELHYWVEVNGIQLDITADQFPNTSGPSYGNQQTEIIKRFTMIEKEHVQKELEINSFAISCKFEFSEIIIQLKKSITKE